MSHCDLSCHAVTRSRSGRLHLDSQAQRRELLRQESLLLAQQDRLLNLLIDDEIDEPTFVRKQTELRDRLASIKLQLDVLSRSHDETAELALREFELSQSLRQRRRTAGCAAKRRVLEIDCLNCRLDDATLVLEMRKPFDVLAEGLLVQDSGGGSTPVELFVTAVSAWDRHVHGLVGRLLDVDPVSMTQC